jgi:hypothetical protein
LKFRVHPYEWAGVTALAIAALILVAVQHWP